VNFFDYSSTQEQLLLIQGLFQFRYLIELYLLLSFYDVRSYKNNLLLGFMLSVVFLFFESTIYSLSIGSKVLLSGSLANNVFASVIASILLFLLIIKKRYPHSFLYRTNIKLAALVAVIIIIATGARMAILAFFATYFIVSYLETGRKQSFVKQVSWFLSLVVLIYVLGILANQLPKRYNPDKIVSKITIHEFSSDLTKFIEIKPSWETSSLITRLKLYNTSLKMFSENPVCGIGPGRWNIQKMNYGFDKAVLIDSHNGYFSILSQYGLLGLPLMFFIYIFPTTLFYRNSKKKGLSIDFLFYLALINLYISISDLSNSGIFKHQIFSILAFNAIFLLQISKSASTQEITTLERSTSQLTKE
jgi:O-antigen ligase